MSKRGFFDAHDKHETRQILQIALTELSAIRLKEKLISLFYSNTIPPIICLRNQFQSVYEKDKKYCSVYLTCLTDNILLIHQLLRPGH